MKDIIIKDNGGTARTPLEAGSYRAVCYSIVVLGTTYNQAFDKAITQICFTWELPDERITINGEDLPKAISATYTLSLNEKAKLRQMLASWRGRDFTEEELEGFSLSNVLGVPCMLATVIKTSSTGKEFAQVASVVRLPKSMVVPDGTENPQVLFNIMDPEFPLEDMEKLPEWQQNRIKESKEYKERTTSPDDFIVANDEDLPFD